ncbi:MAG TPA: FxsA family protein [Mariprofundaceae bacterium]|nr:FxsA family protein [Mariprofundaceae bacterium]
MFKYFFALFILLPLAELYLLIEVGSGIGGFSTIALCLLTAAIGGMLVRLQGMQTLLQAKKLMDEGQPPAEQMLHGIMIASSGIMLFLPGFITDVIGFILLIPPFRNLLGRWLVGSMVIQQRRKNETIIEAEVVHPDKRNLP